MLCGVTVATAQANSGFAAYLNELAAQARAQGVSQRTIDQIFPNLSFQPHVLELDRAQPGGAHNSASPPIEPYLRNHVDGARVTIGRRKYTVYRNLIAPIEQETGVPESMMISIWGNETNYGSFMGSFDVLDSLATLAYEGRRRTLFSGEFIATLKLLDRGVPRSMLRGSWAGAMGMPQFMPSQYLALGRDGDGDGRIDIWSNPADALASIANYFVANHWKRGVPWGVPVAVPMVFNTTAYASNYQGARCPRVMNRLSKWMPMRDWRALGIVPLSAKPFRDDELMSLLQPDGPGHAAWLTSANYRVILSYNCSNYYGLSVGTLADRILQESASTGGFAN